MLDFATRKHHNPEGENTQKEMVWIVIDSLIIAFIALFSTMPAAIPTKADVWVALKAFFIAFFTQLAIERGLKRQ